MKKTLLKITLSLLLLSPLMVIGGGNSTTFPEETAGMSAYTKLQGINESNNVTKMNEVYAFLEQEGTTITSQPTHVIGTLPISIFAKNTSGGIVHIMDLSPNIYFDIEGWVVAYLDKDEPSAKMIQWSDYEVGSLPPDILSEAVIKIADQIGHSYDSISHYHFQHPEATHLSIVVDLAENTGGRETNYSVTFPGTIHEATYSMFYSVSLGSNRCSTSLEVDNTLVVEKPTSAWCAGAPYEYYFYPDTTFVPYTPHSVVTKGRLTVDDREIRIGMGSVFLYQTD